MKTPDAVARNETEPCEEPYESGESLAHYIGRYVHDNASVFADVRWERFPLLYSEEGDFAELDTHYLEARDAPCTCTPSVRALRFLGEAQVMAFDQYVALLMHLQAIGATDTEARAAISAQKDYDRR